MANEDLKQKIEELEEELRNTKVNKRTEAAVGKLKAKIARLKEELEKRSSKGKKGEGYAVKKEGDATIGLLGKPSVGKSTLLTKLTNKESKIGSYDFTTLDVIPGLMNYKHVDFQILDLPGIIEGASQNKGFGKKVLSIVRVCDLVLLIVDATTLEDIDMLLEETKNSGIRVNKKKPNISINKTHYGGIKIIMNHSEIEEETIKEILRDNRIMNAEVLINNVDVDLDDFIDAIYNNIVYTKGAIVLNKIDKCSKEEVNNALNYVKNKYKNFNAIAISGERDNNLDKLKEFIFNNLGLIQVYLKEPRKESDLEKPLTIKKGSTLEDVCKNIHKDFLKKFKFAKIKGTSVKFDWQRVGISHIVEDKDIIEITLQK